MTGRLASGRAGLRVWAQRGLTLAPSSIGRRAGARPDQGLFPPLPRASGPAQAIAARFAVTGAAVSGGEHALSRPLARVTQLKR